MNNYKIIKLKSGESIICKISEIKDKTVVLERPMIFKTISLPNEAIFMGAEALMMKNWLEFSSDKNVEIPIDFIAALIKPDTMISSCYDFEKEKEDNPLFKKQQMEEMLKQMEKEKKKQILPDKLNINFNIPDEMIPEVLDAMGIDVPSIEDMEDELLEEEEEILPPKPKKSKKKQSKKSEDKSNWGNDWSDWSPDPKDYLN
jgi:hypothetical protein